MSDTTTKRPVLRYHGGKWLMTPWIIEHMPTHAAYVECFGGGASVLLRKPRVQLEVYNDLDDELTNLFAVLRTDADSLAEAVALTPFARTEFAYAYEATEDPLERARRTLIRSHMGHGSNGVHQSTGLRAAGMRAGTLPVHNWQRMPEVIKATAERFKGVVIENRPAIDVMQMNDGPTTLHYVDPPYPFGTRGAGKDYRHELSDSEHADLLAALQALQGKVILSGYACDLYDATLGDWHRVEKEVRADKALKRTEVLWMNFDPRKPELRDGLWAGSAMA